MRQTGFSPHPGLTFPICNLGMTEFCCWLTARHRAWPLVNADQLLRERGLFRVECEGILILLSELSPSFAKCSWNQGKDHHCGFKWRVLRGWGGGGTGGAGPPTICSLIRFRLSELGGWCLFFSTS